MNYRLLGFLKACDTHQYHDLAVQALVLAITDLTRPDGIIPPLIGRARAKGVAALQKAWSGFELIRPELRSLAELEHALEHPDSINETTSLEKDTLRAILASMAQTLPQETQARLARASGDQDSEPLFMPAERGLHKAGTYAITAILALTALVGIAALPMAVTFGGNAWATAIIPLACVALLAYILYRKT